jgi:hypothetical protein
MPSMHVASRYDYIERSVDAYVREHIQTDMGLTVFYRYQNAPSVDSIRPDQYMFASLSILGQIRPTDSSKGRLMMYTEASLDLNVFQKSDAIGTGEINRYSLIVLATNIMNKFEPPSAIPIRDYGTVGNPVSGHISIVDRPRFFHARVPDELPLHQITITVPLVYNSIVEHNN